MKPAPRLLLAASLIMTAFGCQSLGATFTVTVPDDAGPGSLRQAILDANATPDADAIVFNIPGPGPHTLSVATALPDLAHPASIDGFSQPGASPNTLAGGNNSRIQIRLDGARAFGANGLRIRAPGCSVRGLSITGFAGEGIVLHEVPNCVVAGNVIGLAPDGTARANQGSGVQIFGGAGNRIGGVDPSDRNVLGGNFTAGIHILGVGASNNAVLGNFIGTSPDGSAARANFVHGILVQDAPRNRIGDRAPGSRNLISGNFPDGIRIGGTEAVENSISGNVIGPRADGLAGLGSQNGIHLEGGTGTLVGGRESGDGNLIAGNGGFGITIGAGSSGNRILGNRVGVAADGAGLPNAAQGILVRGNGNQLGGILPGEGNEIANNAPGIEVELGSGNSIRGNSIHDNRPRFAGFGGLGIDLAPFGLTANDAGDSDAGPNALLNHPTVTLATVSDGTTRIQGSVSASPTTALNLDFYSNSDCDPSGSGEGQQYLGSAVVTTGAAGQADFDVLFPLAAAGRQITATATDAAGNTSEFGPCTAATIVAPPRIFTVTNTEDDGPGSLRRALAEAQSNPASSNPVIAFAIGDDTGSGPKHVIRLVRPLDRLFEAVTIDGFTQPGANPNDASAGSELQPRILVDGSKLGPGVDGLILDAPGCVVRGMEWTGFHGHGIRIAALGSGSAVLGCRIHHNGEAGIAIVGAANVRIGSPLATDRNFIHGNGTGISITGTGSTGNRVSGNVIGPDPGNSTGTGNGDGLSLADGTGNVIGGTAPGEGNRIAFNRRSGVTIRNGFGNRILGNSVSDNGGPGIVVLPGAQGDLQPPLVTAGTVHLDGVECSGSFAGAPRTDYVLQTFSSPFPGGNGEFFLGSAATTTDAAGNGVFRITTEGFFRGRHLTVTVTGPAEGTSAFSEAITPASTRPPSSFTVRTSSDEGPGSLREALADAGDFLAAGNNRILFAIPGGGVHVITPSTPFTLPPEPVTIDGFSQPGSRPNALLEGMDAVHLIRIDGTRLPGGVGFPITAGGTILRGLSLTRFGTAITLGGTGGSQITGCLIGVDPNHRPAGNTRSGINIESPGNRVGGTEPGDRNLIGGNGDAGILLQDPSARNNQILGNLIGIDFPTIPNALDPFAQPGNLGDGIRIRFGAHDNEIGGDLAGGANTFGFNGDQAISIESGNGNRVLPNTFVVQPLSPIPAGLITVALQANGGIQPPILDQPVVGPDGLKVGLNVAARPKTTYVADFYLGGTPPGASFNLKSFQPFHRSTFTTDDAGVADLEQRVPASPGTFSKLCATLRDPDGNSSAFSPLVTVVPEASADLKLQLQAPLTAVQGVSFDPILVVSNLGPSTATGVVVRVQLGGLTLVAAAAGSTEEPGTVSFAAGNLPPGESRTLNLKVLAEGPGNVQITGSASHAGQDTIYVNNAESRAVAVSLRPGTPSADLKVSADIVENSGAAGDLVTLQFHVTNEGPADASSVQTFIDLPPGTVVESVAATSTMHCEPAGGDLSCTLDTLLAGGSVDVTVRARFQARPPNLDPNFPGTRTVGIKATSAAPDPRPGNNVGFAQLKVETRLFIDGTAENIEWPAGLEGLELESTRDLKPPVAWERVPASRIIRTNDRNRYPRPASGAEAPANEYFRLAGTSPLAETPEFSQVAAELDGVGFPFSDWGQVEFTAPASTETHYANLTINDDWVIRNVPVFRRFLNRAPDRLCLSFPLGTNGAAVYAANTGFVISTNTLAARPPSTAKTGIGTSKRALASGEREFKISHAAARPIKGGTVLRSAQAASTFPNREQRRNECAPAAILNSLEYLNDLFALDLPPTELRLQTIKDAIGWTTEGAPVGEDFLNAEWVRRKQQSMQDKGLPIVTEVTTNAALALAAVRARYDVEIRMTGHVACVVGVAELEDGRYSITLSHDNAQSRLDIDTDDGGTVQEVAILDPKTGILTGTLWSAQFATFIIERPR